MSKPQTNRPTRGDHAREPAFSTDRFPQKQWSDQHRNTTLVSRKADTASNWIRLRQIVAAVRPHEGHVVDDMHKS